MFRIRFSYSVLAFAAAINLCAQDGQQSEAVSPEPATESISLIDQLRFALDDVEANGESLEKLEAIGDMYLKIGDVQRAIFVFNRAIETFGGTEELFLKVARVLAAAERPELSIEMLKIGSEAFPDSLDLMEELGRVYIARGKTYAAISILKRAIETHPEEHGPVFFLADAYRTQEKLEQADALISTLIEKDTDLVEAYLLKTDLLLTNREGKEALDLMESVYEKHPDNAQVERMMVHTYQFFAYLKAEGGELDRAVQSLQKAHQLDPENGEILAGIATMRYELGEYEASEAAFRTLLETNPDSLNAYGLYASFLATQDRAEEARAIYRQGYEKALELGDETLARRYKGKMQEGETAATAP
ncbi:tetratricopeptide repeat protein [Pelagicoccus sp. SDUM812003]|uniref:tetratricopeptide repeat protein n=1 Tax=Pelagicoccus sp. SDUM812003 TaxID=3041267 RepID=UPI00280E034F|nr:tetratricopeptide repeat protein [Pelagicoccus sp. SDUM812003]MDQ8203927.1 tetratricopeptide repeat protein [Pelagicoccus sp. SDUM812003]